MDKKKVMTYLDELLQDEKFRIRFEAEYQKLLISEKIAKLRKESNLSQEKLAKRIHTTKSAISRYESGAYKGYTVTLLNKIAQACNAKLEITFKQQPAKVKTRLASA
ncbi:MAG: helix-turn-helix transcriptional regulator [Candidatus Omnitrophica bacterium]|nr:helix-turn-helix transcriptional regulator [Candidatus Omnitrophota bacterium]